MGTLDATQPQTFEQLDSKENKSEQLTKVINEIKQIKDTSNNTDDNIDIVFDTVFTTALTESLTYDDVQTLLTEMSDIEQGYTALKQALPDGFDELKGVLTKIEKAKTPDKPTDDETDEDDNVPAVVDDPTNTVSEEVDINRNNAEIKADEIQVTLRGEWKKNPEEQDVIKQEIATKLNSYVKLRDCLPDDVQMVLVLAKKALTTTSTGENGESNAVEELEKTLGMDEIEPGDEHNTVDGKFGDQTYKKLLDYIDTSLKDNSEIIANKINVTLRGKRNEENVDIAQVKEDIATQLNTIKTRNRDTSWTDDKKLNDKKAVLLLTKAALESTSNDKAESDEVRALENKLVELNAMQENQTDDNTHNGVDGRFGTETYKIVIAYLTDKNPNDIEITIPAKLEQNIPSNIETLSEKPTLTKLEAEQLAAYNGLLDLAITTIDIDVATALGGHTGVLKLNSLTELTDTDIATELAKNEGDLYLDGLTEISVDVATKLDQHEGYISLQGITTLSGEIAHALEGHDNNLSFGGKIFDKTNITTTDVDEGTTYEYTETSVEGTITFDELRDKLPITDNEKINTIMGNISALNNQLNKGTSINVLKAEINDIDKQLADNQRQKAEIEGKKAIDDVRIDEQITELRSQKDDLEKKEKKKREDKDRIKQLELEINNLTAQKDKYDKQIQTLSDDNTALEEEKKGLNKQLEDQEAKKQEIIVKVTELKTLLAAQFQSSTDSNKKTEIQTYIDKTIPEYVKGLDGQTEEEIQARATQERTAQAAPEAAPAAPKKSRQDAFKEQLENFNKATHQFVKLLAERWGSLFPNSKSAKKLNALSQQYEFEDKMKENKNIDNKKDVYEILLGLKDIKDAAKADGYTEIINVIKTGDADQIRNLQMKLCTPSNNLPITGKIDKNTALALQSYITKAKKADSPKEALSYQCIVEGGYEEAGNINNTKKNIAGTIYKKGGTGNETYIFIGTLKGETCICENIKFDSATQTITPNTETTIIHGTTGEIESGTFNESWQLTTGKILNPDRTEKETVTPEGV